MKAWLAIPLLLLSSNLALASGGPFLMAALGNSLTAGTLADTSIAQDNTQVSTLAELNA